MKAEAVSFLEDFIRKSVGAQYIIPVYQRNYNWKKDAQVKKLLVDIEKLITNSKYEHFIGSIVYIVTKDGLTGQERSVVDGQQRLTTVFLILYALRDLALDQKQESIAKIITTWYLENSTDEDKYKLRLKPSVSDDDTFEAIANRKHDEISNVNSNVYINYLYIKEFFFKMLESYSFDNIIEAMRRLNIVYIMLSEEDNAQLIFESINSTGMELTSADLIRNYVLMIKDNDTQERIYNKYWKKLDNIFTDSKRMEMFFRIYLAVKQNSLINKNKVYTGFIEYWLEEIKTKSNEIIMEEILCYARHYEKLRLDKISGDYAKEISDFRNINSDIPLPVALEILELKRKEILTINQVKDSLHVINTYMVRRYLVEKQTKEISRTFPTCLKNVLDYCNKNDYGNFTEVLKKFLIDNNAQNTAYMPSDNEIEQYLLTANAYVMKNIRWLLERIEMNDNLAVVDFSNLSIEHIMPQTRSNEWIEIIDVSDEDYDSYKNRIGNLTLATGRDNSQMGNKFFDYKKNVLSKTSHIRLNQGILEKDTWRLEEITERTEKMISIILELFSYMKSTLEVSENREISLQIRGEIVASGRLNEDNSITVYADSKIRMDIVPLTIVAKDKREELLANEIISEEDGEFILTENQDFNSPSTAAEFLLGGSVNGWEIWRGHNGDNIDKLFRRTEL